MTCYLIPIGGTGVRVMKSIVYLCMAGCFDGIQFKVMCVDSDEVNGDIKELQTLLKEYNEVPHDLFPEIKLNTINGKENCVWSPLSDNGLSTRSKMRDMVRESSMEKDAKDILHFLYTDEELDKVLEGGFYGHTSIGSYFVSRQVTHDNAYSDVWKDFFDGAKADDKVFIIGSVFGGTGASGVPTISRLIKENSVTSSLPIGAVFVMPYFKPKDNDDELSKLPIDWSTFTTKAKTALSFYLNQNFDKIFSRMYFIGEDTNRFMWVENNDCGEKQHNKANPIEVYAATSLIDFLNENVGDDFVTKFMSMEQAANGQKLLTQKMLNEICDSHCFDKISDFLKFSIIYTKYLYPCIKEEYSAEKWYKEYNIKGNDNDAEALLKMCSNYLEWIKELLVKNDSNGRLNEEDEDNDLIWFHYKQYKVLYDGEPLKAAGKAGFLQKHNRYNLEELDNITAIQKDYISDKTGSTIIIDFANDFAPKSKHAHNNGVSNLKRLKIDMINAIKK